MENWSDFRVAIDESGDSSTLRCWGELDLTGVVMLEDAVEVCLSNRPRLLRIDCATLSFIDATGVKTLVQAAERCRELGVELELRLNRRVRRVLDILGATDRLVDEESRMTLVVPMEERRRLSKRPASKPRARSS